MGPAAWQVLGHALLSQGAAPAPLPQHHTSPCQRYPSVSGMPRVWSGNQTRLLRIDTLPPWLRPPSIFSNLTPTGQGLEAGNQAGQQHRRCSRLRGLTLSTRCNCYPSPHPHPIPKSWEQVEKEGVATTLSRIPVWMPKGWI